MQSILGRKSLEDHNELVGYAGRLAPIGLDKAEPFAKRSDP